MSGSPRPSPLLPLLLAAGCLGSLPFLVHPWYTPYADSAVYLTTAQSLAETGTYSFLGRPFTLRPPGFALFLAPLLRVFGHDFLALNTAVSLTGVAGVLALFLLSRPSLGAGVAILLAVAAWLNPLWQHLGTSILSDMPGFALALAVLALERRAARAPGPGRELALGAAIGAATLVRSINVFLLPAVLLPRLLAQARAGSPPWRTFARTAVLPLCAATLLVVGPWAARNAAVGDPGPADQIRIHSYGVAQWHTRPDDPASPRIGLSEFLSRTAGNARTLVLALGTRGAAYGPGGRRTRSGATPAAAALLLAGSALALYRRREPQDLFLAANVAILLVYFELRVRLFLPIVVLALAATADTALAVLRRARLGRAAPALVGAGLVLVAAADFSPRRDWNRLETLNEVGARQAAAILPLVPEDTRIGAWPAVDWSPFLGRPVHNLALLYSREPERGLQPIIDRYRLGAILASPELPPAAWEELRSRYGEGATALPGADLVLFRVRPSAAPADGQGAPQEGT